MSGGDDLDDHRQGRTSLVSPVLVGRAAERDALRAVVAVAPALAVVVGEAGVGKSRLIGEVLQPSAVGGPRVLVGRAYRIREPFPLGPVLEAVSSAGEAVGDLTLTPLAGSLRPLLPELAHLLPVAPEPLADPVAERHRIFRALAEVLERVGSAVLVLEDLHWADGYTLEFLGFLHSRQPPKLALVISYRGEEAPDELRLLTSRPPPTTAVSRIDLRPLDVRDTGQLAAAILDAPHVTDEFAAHVRERTSGLPFAIEEVLAMLQERGDVLRHSPRWARRELAALKVPGAIRDAVLDRLSRLSVPGRTMVEAAAVLQVPVSEAVIQATSGLTVDAATTALASALTSGMLEEQGGRVGFRHVLAAQAVEEALPGPQRRVLHARAADTLGALDPVPLGQLAHHLRRADRLEQWARCAEQAADRAATLGHDAGAAQMLNDVLTGAPLEPAQRVRIASKLTRAALYGVSHEDALGSLRDVLENDDIPQADRGELRRGVAQLLAQAGDEPAAYQQFETAVSELEDNPASQARAMAALSILHVPDRRGEQVAWADRALAVLQSTHDPSAEAVVRGNRIVTLLSAGDPSWRDDLPAIRTRPTSVEHRRLLARATHNVGITACFTGHLPEAEQLLQEASRHLEKCGGELTQRALEAAEAVRQFTLGHWDGLDEVVDRLAGDLIDLPVHRVDMEWVAGSLRMARGDLEGARNRFDMAWQLCAGLTSVEVTAAVAGALSRLHLARDDPQAAVTHAMHGVAVATTSEMWVPAGWNVRWAVEALITAGDLGAAQTLGAQFATSTRGRDAPASTAAVHMCHGLLAAAAGRNGDAARAYQTAAAGYAALPCPYEAAQAHERAAGCLFATAGERASATILTSLEGYESLGASWDAARAARTARRWGLTLPTPYRGGRRGYGSELSPRERAVAQLAAAGLSNNEIGEQLFLSTRTVEKHVSRALHKLGAASRRDLRHLSGELTGPAG